MMADGATRSIADVRPGDRVVGRNGVINDVLQVEEVVLGQRPLHGVNGGPAFFTAGHPFLTAAGWKSVDPEQTALGGRRLSVERLAVGDELIALDDGVRRNAEWRSIGNERTRRLRRVGQAQGQPETRLYNLILSGDGSHHANGWVVASK